MDGGGEGVTIERLDDDDDDDGGDGGDGGYGGECAVERSRGGRPSRCEGIEKAWAGSPPKGVCLRGTF